MAWLLEKKWKCKELTDIPIDRRTKFTRVSMSGELYTHRKHPQVVLTQIWTPVIKPEEKYLSNIQKASLAILKSFNIEPCKQNIYSFL